MKNIILCTFFVPMCLLAEVKGSEQRTEIGCADVTHHSDGHVTAVGCPDEQCAPGKHIGYREEDLSKPYPEYCRSPICKD